LPSACSFDPAVSWRRYRSSRRRATRNSIQGKLFRRQIAVTETPAPSPAEQVEFLGNIERVLSEGQFVATYKYALLVAIADLAVQMGSDAGSELDLPVRSIAEKFIELYWRQCAPYGNVVADGAYGVPIQST